MAEKAEGMMVAFIDFSKAYDRVNRGQLLRCLEGLGIDGSFLQFLKALYNGTSCRVKVDNKQSDEFSVTSGLRHEGEVEDVVHWLIRCPPWIGHREVLLKQCYDHSSNSDEDTTARLLCLACHNHKIAAEIHTMWKVRFGT